MYIVQDLVDDTGQQRGRYLCVTSLLLEHAWQACHVDQLGVDDHCGVIDHSRVVDRLGVIKHLGVACLVSVLDKL